jgi:hypothetical protein
MPVSTIGLAPLQVNSTVLPIQNLQMPQNLKKITHRHSGNLFPTLVGTPAAEPMLKFQAPFAAAYSLFSLACLPITTLGIYLAEFVNDQRAPTASDMYALASSPGAATAAGHITGVSVSLDGILFADCEIFLLSYDGMTHPLGALQTGQTLPTFGANPQLHTLGPIASGAGPTVISGINSATLRLNQRYVLRRHGGDMFPRLYQNLGGDPTLTGDHSDPKGLLAALGLTGTGTGQVVQYFRSYSLSDGSVSLANSVSLTIPSNRANPGQMEIPLDSYGKHNFEVIGLSASATNPVIVSLSATSPSEP